MSAAKEKSQMPGAALAATEWAKQQGNEDSPLQNATTVGAQNILAAAEGAFPGP
jgi:hypothetical protein